jgi:hypothetical protein
MWRRPRSTSAPSSGATRVRSRACSHRRHSRTRSPAAMWGRAGVATDDVVKVEVWDVVDKGGRPFRTGPRTPHGACRLTLALNPTRPGKAPPASKAAAGLKMDVHKGPLPGPGRATWVRRVQRLHARADCVSAVVRAGGCTGAGRRNDRRVQADAVCSAHVRPQQAVDV